jgi:hypothetical protein
MTTVKDEDRMIHYVNLLAINKRDYLNASLSMKIYLWMCGQATAMKYNWYSFYFDHEEYKKYQVVKAFSSKIKPAEF